MTLVGDLAPHRRRAGARGVPAIRGRGQNVVGHVDQRHGVLGDVAVLGEHEGDGLAHIGHLAVGERERPAAVERGARIRGPHHAPLGHRRRDVVEDEHGEHAGQRPRRRCVDRGDQRMGMRAAHEGRMQRVGRRDVADIAAGAGEQRVVFETRQAGADGAHVRQATSQACSATLARAVAPTPLPACGERSDRASDPGEGAVSRV